MVGVPEATENIRSAPVRALRAIFSGVGQLLLAADRLREEDAERERAEPAEPDDQVDPPGSWDSGPSSSVRIIPPTNTDGPARPPVGSGGASPRASTVPDSQGSSPMRPSTAGSARAGQRPTSTESKKARQAEPARAGRPSRTGETRRAGKPGLGSQAATPARSNGTAGDRTSGQADRKRSGRKPGRGKRSAEPSRFRSLDLTGNVRMLTDEDIADLTTDALERGEAGPRRPTAGGILADAAMPPWSDAVPAWSSWSSSPRPESEPIAAESHPAPAAYEAVSAVLPTGGLPIAGYDELSLPSLRARLRQFNVDQLGVLLAHERSSANRRDVVTMFERRIAKLNELDELADRRSMSKGA